MRGFLFPIPSGKSSRRIHAQTSASAAHPSATATLAPGFLLAGGGAQSSSAGAGQLLVQSSPSSTTSWYAESKDHIVSDLGSVTAFAIGIPECPSGASRCLQAAIASAGPTNTGPGYGSTSQTGGLPTYARASVGARSLYNDAGRLLVSLFPSSAGGVVLNKDHAIGDTGNLFIDLVAIRGVP